VRCVCVGAAALCTNRLSPGVVARAWWPVRALLPPFSLSSLSVRLFVLPFASILLSLRRQGLRGADEAVGKEASAGLPSAVSPAAAAAAAKRRHSIAFVERLARTASAEELAVADGMAQVGFPAPFLPHPTPPHERSCQATPEF